jgi:MFS family permease
VSTTVRARLVSVAGGIDRSIAVLALLSFISQVGVSIMLPLLPLYAVEVGATPTQLGLMVGAFSVTSTIGQLAAGVLSGYISARRQMPLGQAVYATGNFLIATTASAVPLIAFRAMSGLGGGLTIIAERLYIARVTAQERLAFVNGVVSAAGSSGSVIGPLLGAVLALQELRVPFIVVGITATIAAVAALAFLPAERRPAPSEAGADDATTPDGASAGVATAAAGAGVQDRAGARAGRWARIAPLARLALWSVCFNAAYGGWITTFAPYATGVLGLEPSYVALFFVPFGAGAIVLGPVLARLADRTGRRRMVAFGTLLVLTNIASLVLAAPVALIYGTAVIAGGGLAAAQASWFALLGVATDGGRRGRSFGLVSALSNLGVIAGAGAASIAWDRIGLREGVITAGAFLVVAAMSLVLVPSDRARLDSGHGPGPNGSDSGGTSG